MTVAPETLQAEFAAALRDPSPAAVPDSFAQTAARRFRIYRNNARVALIEALAANYPVVRRIVGEGFFAGMAQAYSADRPSQERTLNFYGAGFDRFVESFEPAGEMPYLGDVARLERAVLEARHAADAAPLDPGAVTALGNDIATARLLAHPATRLVRSEYPVADIWNAHQDAAARDDPMVFAAGTAAALVLRPGLEVNVQPLGAAACAFTEAVLGGSDLMVAHAAATAHDDQFDVLAVFRDLLAAGVFAGIATEPQERNNNE